MDSPGLFLYGKLAGDWRAEGKESEIVSGKRLYTGKYFWYIGCMKLLIKLFLLAAFAIIVFVPIRVEYEWVIWLLFILMFALVALYYMLTYWISVKGILKAASAEEAGIQKPSDILFTTFSVKVPGDYAALELI